MQCVGDILLQSPSLHSSLSGFASLLNLLSSRGLQVAPSKAQLSSFQVTYLDSLSDQLKLSQCVLEHTLSRPSPHGALHDVSHQCPPLQQFLSQVTLQLPMPNLPLITAVTLPLGSQKQVLSTSTPQSQESASDDFSHCLTKTSPIIHVHKKSQLKHTWAFHIRLHWCNGNLSNSVLPNTTESCFLVALVPRLSYI